MLYLVGGASRSGKSLIARKILVERRIPYLSLDWLMMGFNDGLPEYGIHHRLWPNEIAEKMAPFVQGMIGSMLLEKLHYVIEGEAMLPEMVAELVERHPGRIRAVFLGYATIGVRKKIALVKGYGGDENDWLTRKSDSYIREHVANMIAYSKTIRSECKKHGLPYCDTSDDFSRSVATATELLVGNLEATEPAP